MKTQLEIYREQIDEIDKILAENFEKRMEVISLVADYKRKNHLDTFDPTREQKMREKNQTYIKNEMLKKYYLEYLQNYVNLSKKYQNDIRKNIED